MGRVGPQRHRELRLLELRRLGIHGGRRGAGAAATAATAGGGGGGGGLGFSLPSIGCGGGTRETRGRRGGRRRGARRVRVIERETIEIGGASLSLSL